jgi:membrane protease YdiL (CAAX protease family)
MSAAAFWGRVAVATAVAASLAIVLAPPHPHARVPAPLAPALGVAAGAALFAAALRRPPAFARLGSAPAAVCKQLFLGLCAANEEVLWRRVLLGELLPIGPLLAVGISSAGFAVAHRRARSLHVCTGAAFGALYVGTGFLGASIAAHWVYNALVASLAKRAPP